MPRLGAFSQSLPGAVGTQSVGFALPSEAGLSGLDDDDDVKSEVGGVRSLSRPTSNQLRLGTRGSTIAELYACVNSTIAKHERFSRLTKVMAKVVRVWNIPPVKAWARPRTYCVVKGIRQTASLVHIATSQVMQNVTACMLQFEFGFDVPEDWAYVELVGLKLMLYACEDSSPSPFGTDQFLGGCDIDLACLASQRKHSIHLGCDGTSLKYIKSKKAQKDLEKPKMTVDVVVYREYVKKPLSPVHKLIPSLREHTRVRKMEVHIREAIGLRRADFLGKSDPQCIVSVIFAGGQAREIYRTEIVKQSLSPEWHERFAIDFIKDEDPMMIAFDVWDWDTDEADITQSGDHLGSVVVPIPSLRDSNAGLALNLQGCSSLLDRRLDQKGFPINRRKGVRDVMDDGRKDPTRPTSRSAAIRQRLDTWWKHRSDRLKNGTLYVDLELDRIDAPMPHLDLMEQNITIESEMDGEEWMESWRQSASCFTPPSTFADGSTSLVGLSITGFPRIIFVMGMLEGCSGLVGPGAFDQITNSYIILEGCSMEGDKQFIHRTRVAEGNNNPQFMEPFYIALSGREFDQFDLCSLIVSIYNVADGSGTDEEDSKLGYCTVDVSSWRNGQEFHEEVPLNGVKRTLLSGAGHFRRPSVVSLRAFVERRIKPELKIVKGGRPTGAVPPRNTSSRLTSNGNFCNAADEFIADSARPAARVLVNLFEEDNLNLLANRLPLKLKQRRDQQWMTKVTKPVFMTKENDPTPVATQVEDDDVTEAVPSPRRSPTEQVPAIVEDLITPTLPAETPGMRKVANRVDAPRLRVNSWLSDFQADSPSNDVNARKPEYELYDWSGLGKSGPNSSWLLPRAPTMKISAPKTLPPQLLIEDGQSGSKWKKETMDHLRVMLEIRQKMPPEYMTKVRNVWDLD